MDMPWAKRYDHDFQRFQLPTWDFQENWLNNGVSNADWNRKHESTDRREGNWGSCNLRVIDCSSSLSSDEYFLLLASWHVCNWCIYVEWSCIGFSQIWDPWLRRCNCPGYWGFWRTEHQERRIHSSRGIWLLWFALQVLQGQQETWWSHPRSMRLIDRGACRKGFHDDVDGCVFQYFLLSAAQR